MSFSEEDMRKLNAVIDKETVKHWMKSISQNVSKYGPLDSEDIPFYRNNLRAALKVTDLPTIVSATESKVVVETEDMKIELINGVLYVNPK